MCIIGCGETKEQAVFDADSKYYCREEFLAKPSSERLEILLQQKQLLSKKMNEAIKSLGNWYFHTYDKEMIMGLDTPSVILTCGMILVAGSIAFIAYDAGKNRVFVDIENYGCEKVIQLHKEGKR